MTTIPTRDHNPEIAVGTKVFKRTDKLSRLLESIPSRISHVYVADDGETTAERAKLYDRSFDFELTVLNLEYDAGIGQGRKCIVDESDEEYLLIVDSDHEVPDSVDILVRQLEADPELGGVAGNLLEPNQSRFYQGAHDLREQGDVLIRDTVPEEKPIRFVAGHPFVPFDFIPNAAMFRRTSLEDYCWDPEYVIGKEHLDFYVGHWKQTDWTFGICPEVVFPHYPGGTSDYVANRHSISKEKASMEYFLDKWGYSHIEWGRPHWFSTHGSVPPLPERVIRTIRTEGLVTLVRKIGGKLRRR